MRRTPRAILLALVSVLVATGLTTTSASAAPSAEAQTVAAAPAARKAARDIGTPPIIYAPPSGNYFAYPNRSKQAKLAIRNRVLNSIKGTWGGRRTSIGTPMPGNGKIRIATWTFDDWSIARALVAARARGVSVQVIAAKAANKQKGPWKYLKKRLGSRLIRPGYPASADTVSFARECRGSCRGPGGTAHAKYFLFDKIGRGHQRYVTFQTSMNLTRFGYTGQWNQATVMKFKSVYDDYLGVFKQARLAHRTTSPYHVRTVGPKALDYFFPRPGARAAEDPVMQTLRLVSCTGAGYGGTANHRTRIRIIQYAMYGDRGVWIAKRLRALWNAGCDVRMIYSVITRPVLQILRSGSGRGPIPLRQSVTKNGAGEIVKYNHSKWMTITGHWGSLTSAWVTFNGSANWSLAAFANDEQMQRIRDVSQTKPYLAAFNTTWNQKTSKKPPHARLSASGRALPIPGVPETAPTWGKGIYKFMQP
ncbi:phospholipase D-like domain-containing protein [Marmoricola sp. URHB0036]|uniref:phospholipase D-like domain-containing protein n=1 Tax=Marmoricola sp. URHB0036 TaxID=1298863 RepID=UPI000428D08C|nr:phospholipase D-like domain-containing protein [Marmoricola sp. URHB0036]